MLLEAGFGAPLPAGWVSDPSSTDGPDNIAGYAGYRFNHEAENYAVRFRVYLPDLGRWAQRDPVGYLGSSMNLYEYAFSDPVRYLDPDGLCPTCDASGNVQDALGKGYNQQHISETEFRVVSTALMAGLALATPVDEVGAGWWLGAKAVNAARKALKAAREARRAKKAADAAKAADRAADAQEKCKDAAKGLRKQVEKHKKKLKDYKSNPDKYDDKGFLKDAPPDRRQKIIDSRIRGLENSIKNYQEQIKRIEDAGGGG